jgi:copper chaperone
MRTTIAALSIGLALLATGCQSGPPQSSRSGAETAPAGNALDVTSTTPIDASKAVLTVHGLGCPLCAHNVDEQLTAVKGVKDVEVDLGTGNITVGLADASRPTPAQLAAAVDRSGFTLVRITTP